MTVTYNDNSFDICRKPKVIKVAITKKREGPKGGSMIQWTVNRNQRGLDTVKESERGKKYRSCQNFSRPVHKNIWEGVKLKQTTKEYFVSYYSYSKPILRVSRLHCKSNSAYFPMFYLCTVTVGINEPIPSKRVQLH